MKRIAVFFNLSSGGAKRTVFDIVSRLSDRYTVDAYSYSTSEHEFGDIRPYVRSYRVYPISPLRMMASPFGRVNPLLRMVNLARYGRLARAAAEEIERGKYDLALVEPCQVEFAPSVLRYIRSTPTIYYCHELPRVFYEVMPARPYDAAENPRRKRLNRVDPLPGLYRKMVLANDRRNASAAGRVLVNSHYSAGQVESAYHREARPASPGIDAGFFTRVPLPREPFFLSVGSLTRLKGFDFLITALGRLPPSIRFPLVVVSNFQASGERRYLEDLAQVCGVRLSLRSGVSDEQLVRLYNQAALTLYAPVREPFGLVPVESMACGTPVAAVCEGGVPETVVHGQTGLLVERDAEAFASAVGSLASRPEIVDEYGAGGRRHVQDHWSWERVLPAIEKNFIELAG